MGSGKPLGDGIYWPSNKDEEKSQMSPRTRQSVSPSKYGSALSPNSQLKSSKSYWFDYEFSWKHE